MDLMSGVLDSSSLSPTQMSALDRSAVDLLSAVLG